MKNLEELLSNQVKPTIKVNTFRQNLRRELLNSAYYQKTEWINYRFGFFVSTAVAAGCAFVLILFILKPDLSARLNASFKSEDSLRSSQEMLAKYNELYPSNDKKGILTSNDYPNPDIDVDRELVRYLSDQYYKNQSVNLQPTNDVELYMVRKYRLNDEKDVIVYTAVPNSQQVKESY